MTDTVENQTDGELQYTGFWARFGACLIDTLILLAIIIPTLVAIYGWNYFQSTALFQGSADVFMNWIFPLIAVIAFWIYKQATPGKMAIDAKIVDAKTGGKPTAIQFFIRYIGYIISTIPLCLGFFWVGWDKKKQGWHDKLAGTVVVNPKSESKSYAPADF